MVWKCCFEVQPHFAWNRPKAQHCEMLVYLNRCMACTLEVIMHWFYAADVHFWEKYNHVYTLWTCHWLFAVNKRKLHSKRSFLKLWSETKRLPSSLPAAVNPVISDECIESPASSFSCSSLTFFCWRCSLHPRVGFQQILHPARWVSRLTGRWSANVKRCLRSSHRSHWPSFWVSRGTIFAHDQILTFHIQLPFTLAPVCKHSDRVFSDRGVSICSAQVIITAGMNISTNIQMPVLTVRGNTVGSWLTHFEHLHHCCFVEFKVALHRNLSDFNNICCEDRESWLSWTMARGENSLICCYGSLQ